ncbi:MAG: hypothetical protein QOJ66_3773 [Ilumatobacteraceae bacterium]
MSLARFLAGIPLMLFALGPIGLAAGAWRRLLFPAWTGSEARLVEVVIALASVTVIAETLGTFGAFATFPVVAGLAAAGLLGWLIARRQLRRRADAMIPEREPVPSSAVDGRGSPRWSTAAAVGGILLVAGSWLTRTVASIEHGMNTVDSFWYHLPAAARFVQTGHTFHIQYFDQDPTTAFYPMTASLLHGIGFLMFKTDLVSTVINLGWFALALVAAWCIGRPFGVAAATTLGALLVLGSPAIVGTQPGGAYDDVAGLALLLAAMAVVVQDREEPRSTAQDVVVGLAAGLAVGMKFIFIVPAAALCLGLAITSPKGLRSRRAVVLLAGASVTGGYWYVRNAFASGSPLPSLSLKIGSIGLPSVKAITPTATVGKFLFDGRAWTDNFIPGLRISLGPAWIAILGFAIAGLMCAVAQGAEARVRVLGVFGLVSFAAFLYTPQNLVGGFGRPSLFASQVRLDATALAVGLVLLPIVLRRSMRSVLTAYVIAVAVTEIDPSSWPTGFRWATFAGRVNVHDAVWSVALLVAATVLVWVSTMARPRVSEVAARTIAALVVPVCVVLALAAVHVYYLDHRYVDAAPFPKIYSWPREIHHARIAVSGFYMQGQYPLAGLDLTDYVQFAGVRTEHGGFREFASCVEWVDFLQSGRYDYVVLGPTKNLREWTAAQPDAHIAVTQPIGASSSASVTIFRLDAAHKPRSC